tara:strand:- start:5873 stop:6643 length:771 start_codon:yes stop_codon:yes gene_type:complete
LKNKIKVSIITPTYNSERTISDNLVSILNQNYENWEIIIVDNLSTDQTINKIKKLDHQNIRIISEKDKGIYDAINKGIDMAKGDIISILHSDDFYYDKSVLLNVTNAFNQFSVDAVYGNLIYVEKLRPDKILRFWKSKQFEKNDFFKGQTPPHPSFFVKKDLYKKLGNYKVNLGNSSDFELMYRFLEKNSIKNKHIDKIFVSMRYGGASNNSIYGILKQNLVIINILNINFNIKKIIIFLFTKLTYRIIQFIKRPI